MLFIRRAPPYPTFANVESAGTGWYKYGRDGLFGQCKWRRVEGLKAYNPEAKWLSANRLKELELDAVVDSRLAARVKRR